MNILVAGGAGFIGSHVVRAYLAAGHKVIVLDNLSSGFKENIPPGVPFLQADIRQPDLADLLQDYSLDVINNHAAQISVPDSVIDPIYDAQINVVGLVNLLQTAVRLKVDKFIQVSSGGAVYGEPDSLPVAEDFPARPLSPYAVSKLSGEHYLYYYNQAHSLKTLTLRYANVYGPRQRPHGEAGVAAIFMRCILTGKSPVIYRSADMPGGMLRDYVHASDCAQANVAALQQGLGPYNVGTGLATSTLDLWLAIAQIAGSSLPHNFGPVRQGDIQRVALSSAKAHKELNWEPAFALAEGLADTWAWAQSEPIR